MRRNSASIQRPGRSTLFFAGGLCGLLIKHRGSELDRLNADTGTMPEDDVRLGPSRGSTEQGGWQDQSD